MFSSPKMWAVKSESNLDSKAYSIVKVGDFLYSCGYFRANITFFQSGCPVAFLPNTSTMENPCIIKTSTSGQVIWVNHIETSGNGSLHVIRKGPGGLYVSGYLSKPGIFRNACGEENFRTDLTGLVFVAKVDHQGNWLFYSGAQSTRTSNSYGLDIIGKKILLTGYFLGDLQFLNTPFKLSSPTFHSAFYAQMDLSGKILWVNSISGNGDIYTGACSRYYVVGSIDGSQATFIGKNTLTFSNLPSSAFYVARLSKRGEWLWASFGGGYNGHYPIKVDSYHDFAVVNLVYASEMIFYYNNQPVITLPNANPTLNNYAIVKINRKGEWLKAIYSQNVPNTPISTYNNNLYGIFVNKKGIYGCGQLGNSMVFDKITVRSHNDTCALVWRLNRNLETEEVLISSGADIGVNFFYNVQVKGDDVYLCGANSSYFKFGELKISNLSDNENYLIVKTKI